MTEVSSAGFPHSDICGSKDICSSPQLFAAYHVFLRLLVPRHPPCALISLTFLVSLDFISVWNLLLWVLSLLRFVICYYDCFLFDVLLSFLIFLRLISVFGFQGTTLTVFISHSSVLLRLRTRNLWLLVLKSIQMLFASSSHIWKQAFICSSSRKTLEWRRRDSNSWPPACKAGALPTELRPHVGEGFQLSLFVLFLHLAI